MTVRWLWAAALLLLVGQIGWAALDRAKPVEQVANVAVRPVIAGEEAVIESRVVRHRVCWTRLQRSVYDGEGFRKRLPDMEFDAVGDLGPDRFRQAVSTDPRSSPGAGEVRFVVSWRCTPLDYLWPIAPEVIRVPITILPRPPP